jgi:lipoprotein signal peptidase
MKRLLLLLILAVSSPVCSEILAASARYASVEVRADSIVPLKRISTKTQKPETTAVLSAVASGLGFLSVFSGSGWLFLLIPLGLVLGIIALVRILKSKGQRKGLGWAGVGTILGAVGVSIIIALIRAFR